MVTTYKLSSISKIIQLSSLRFIVISIIIFNVSIQSLPHHQSFVQAAFSSPLGNNSFQEVRSRIKNSLLSGWRRGAPPLPISDEIGTSPTFQYRYFDPLRLATEENFVRFREAELKHGRVAMLAVLGNTIPDIFHNVFVPSGLLSPSRNIAFRDIPCGLKAIPTIPSLGWFQIVVLIGILETTVFVQRSLYDMPGDYQLGYFGLRDKGQHERSLQSELENGRLAMVAFLFQIIIELVTGQTPINQLNQMFSSVSEVNDIVPIN